MSHDAIVETHYGKVRGTDLGSVAVWKGIPYAQPPIEKLRFHVPQAPEAWSGVRDASKFGAVAPQDVAHLSGLTQTLQGETTSEQAPISEDCLYLNIWSPRADEKKRPVMVWIHGGAFIIGSGSQPDYDGTSFAQQGDVVVVTLNYRLGVLGFLQLGDFAGAEYASAGNLGLLDQIAALKWVRENIAVFGGDPNNVTIFGESAGAMSIGALLAMPASKGLFQKAILESGAAHNVQDRASATKAASELLDILGLSTHEVAALTHIPLQKLLAAQTTLLTKNPLGGIRPVVDGKDIPELPVQAIAGGVAKDVAILIGTNRDEMKLFMSEPSESSQDASMAQRLLGERTIEVFSTYAAAQPGADMREIGLSMFTDYTFRIPAIRLAESQVQQGAPVWMYRFDWPSPNPKFGACHALEIPFVWNTLETSLFRALTGKDAPQALASTMHAAWIAFAHTGNPNTPKLPHWPAYDADRRATMLFDGQCSIADDPQGTERAVWGSLL
ncbi:MAG: carboxylesterase/lipase family protein [Ktedonobacteraceae bacterium]